jgi:hypothetical protein
MAAAFPEARAERGRAEISRIFVFPHQRFSD